MKLLIANSFQVTDADVERFKGIGFDEVYVARHEQPPAEVCDHPEEIEVLIQRDGYLQNFGHLMPGLRMVQMSMAGLDTLEPDLLDRFPQVKLYSGSGCYGVSIAEWSLGKVLEIYRQHRLFESYQAENKWSWEGSFDSMELWGKTAAVFGTGDIGTQCAKRLKAFRCKVLGVNTSGQAGEYFDACYTKSQLPELLPQCDVLILTMPLTPQTEFILDREALSHVKQGAVLVVNSRGSLVDERAMCEMLDSGHLRGAALDCFEVEPVPPDSPLWDQKNLLIQPHCCGVTQQLRDRYLDWFYDNLKRYFNGEQPVGLVVAGKGY